MARFRTELFSKPRILIGRDMSSRIFITSFRANRLHQSPSPLVFSLSTVHLVRLVEVHSLPAVQAK